MGIGLVVGVHFAFLLLLPQRPKLQLCDEYTHGSIIGVCMQIFTTSLRNKNTVKFSIKIPHLTSTVHRLLSDRLLC